MILSISTLRYKTTKFLIRLYALAIGFFLAVGIYTAVFFLETLVKSFVLTKLWLWFLTPLGLPNITIAQGLGIYWTAALLDGRLLANDFAPLAESHKLKEENPNLAIDYFLRGFLSPLYFLALSYFVKSHFL